MSARRSRVNIRRNQRVSRRRPRRTRSNIIPATRFNPQRNRILRSPPSIALNSNLVTLWIRSELEVNEVKQDKTFKYSVLDAIDQIKLGRLFNEIRIKRVNFWFQSKLSIQEPGLNAMAIFDNKQEALSTKDFSVIAACPGSDTRRVYQTLCGTWYPTEPADRNWLSFNNAAFCLIYLSTSRLQQDSKTLYGALIADAHVSLRGLSVSSTTRLLKSGAGFQQQQIPAEYLR